MAGILLVTHDALGASFIEAATHVFGALPERLTAVGVSPDEPPEVVSARVSEAISRADHGNGVIVLTDLHGATPSNAALRGVSGASVAVIGGLNLPMLLRVVQYRKLPMAELVDKALAGGREGVMRLDQTRD